MFIGQIVPERFREGVGRTELRLYSGCFAVGRKYVEDGRCSEPIHRPLLGAADRSEVTRPQ